MRKITVTLIDLNKSSFEIEVEYDIIAEASVIEYRKNFYMYKSRQESFYKPTFEQIKTPAFVG